MSSKKMSKICGRGVWHLSLGMADDSFKEFVLDQLGALPELRAKAMFGAHGLYCGDSFFGILDEGRLFFKTDEQSQADYIARGMGPFTYQMKGKTMTMAYHEVPPDVLEQPQELTLWARRAIQIAAAKTKKSPKGGKAGIKSQAQNPKSKV
jgi:DNA transformation protein